MDGQFVELADLLSANLQVVEQETQTFLESKLVDCSSKRRQVEIKDILTWTEAFTIFQMVLCTVHPHRWPDLPKYKLLIIQTARHFSGSACLEYDLAVRTDAAASGLSDWSRMNLDLYNFHCPGSTPATSFVFFHGIRSISCRLPVKPAWSLHSAICATTDSVVSPFVGANIDTAAVTVKVNKHKSTVHFPTPVSPTRGKSWTVVNGRLCRRGLCT